MEKKNLLYGLLGSFCLVLMGTDLVSGIFSQMSQNGMLSKINMALKVDMSLYYNILSCIALIGAVFFFAFSICLIKAGVGELVKKKTRPEKKSVDIQD